MKPNRALLFFVIACVALSCAEGPPGPAPAPHPSACSSSVDFNTDPLNCGECGNACPVDDHGKTKCENGRCNLACEPPWRGCTIGLISCETNLDTAKDNCGSCGVKCGTGEHCEFGGCHYDKKVSWTPRVS